MAQFTNQAQLTYNNSVISSNVAVGEILEVLSAAKTALSVDYTLGEDVTYVISAVNTGAAAITDFSVTDDLGAYTVGTETFYPLTYTDGSVRMYINGVLQPAPVVTAGPPLVFSGITLPADSNLIIVYEAQVNQFAPLDTLGSITNTATVDGNGIPTPIIVSETVTPENEPNLTITKSIQPIPVTENSRVTYTFLLQNYGEEQATDMLHILRDLVKKDYSVYEVCRQIRLNTNYTTRMHLFDFLYSVAAIDNDCTVQEQTVLHTIATELRISSYDYTSIRARHTAGHTSYGSSYSSTTAKNPYSVLGIEKTATDDEVKKAYRRLAMKFHPDKVEGLGEEVKKNAEQQFREINEAYETIKKQRGIA